MVEAKKLQNVRSNRLSSLVDRSGITRIPDQGRVWAMQALANYNRTASSTARPRFTSALFHMPMLYPEQPFNSITVDKENFACVAIC